jgi:hypothetical protein
MLVEVGPAHQSLVLHRHQHRVRRAVLLRAREVLRAVELRQQHHRAAACQRGDHHHQRGVGVQRRGDQRDRVGAVAAGFGTPHLAPAHRVRLHDAFGRAGGARRIDDVERPCRVDAHWRPARAKRFEPLRQREVAIAVVEPDALHAGAADVGRHRLRVHGIEEQMARAGVRRHAGDLRRRAARRQRRHRDARAQRTHEQHQIRVAGMGADRDRVARLQAIALQRGGHAVHRRIELGIAQALVAAHQRGGVGACARMARDQVGQRLKVGQRLGRGHDNGLESRVHARSIVARRVLSRRCARYGGPARIVKRKLARRPRDS